MLREGHYRERGTMNTRKVLRCWRWVLVFSILILFPIISYAATDGELEPDDSIPQDRTVDVTGDVLRRCASGRIACKPLLADEQRIRTVKPFKSWSIFLICSPSLLRDSSSDRVTGLFNEFTGFGRALGGDHAAVWFVRRRTGPGNPGTIANLDIDRNVMYCSTLKLDLGKSPHVLVTRKWPSLDRQIDYDLILSLGGMNLDSIDELLTALATQIGNEQISQSVLDSTAWRLKLKQAAEKALKSVKDVASQTKVTIKVAGVDVTVEPVKAPK